MTQVSAFISIDDPVQALKYDYDRYLLSHIQFSKQRRPMSTEFNVYPVMLALVDEILANENEDKAADRVVKSIISQGVDVVYATKMAMTGRNRLLTAIDHGLGGISFKQLEGGSIDIADNNDAMVRYSKE